MSGRSPPTPPGLCTRGAKKGRFFGLFASPLGPLRNRPSQATGEPGGRGLWRTAYGAEGGDPGPWTGPGRPLTGPIGIDRVDVDTPSERDERVRLPCKREPVRASKRWGSAMDAAFVLVP